MNTNFPKLHIFVDSRETSISFARSYFKNKDNLSLGVVEHVRGSGLAVRLAALLVNCSFDDRVLISVHYLSEEHLLSLSPFLKESAHSYLKISLAAYDCFQHIPAWCEKTGVQFLANPYKRRSNPEKNSRSLKCSTREKSCLDQVMVERIWVQYRLILSIISRSEMLGSVCRKLILGKAANGENITDEYARALRYFMLGEPDMAGGTYSCETDGKRNAIDDLRLRINKIAATDFNVLVKGESGSGKEAVAWAIHELSLRRDKPFLAINCAGLPDELLESEMFGYRKGSHNQAFEDTCGLLETVSGGTLFLDELPEMSPRIQAKLLRFMENGEFRPLGGTENRYANARIIAAGQPERLENPSGLRPDLKSRLSQLDVEILPLRAVEKQNPGTIFKIAFILLERYTWTQIFHQGAIQELTPYDIKIFQDTLSEEENIVRLSRQDWKESNARELNNFLRRWIVLGDEEMNCLNGRKDTPGPVASPDTSLCLYDDALKLFLQNPRERSGLKALFALKPLLHLKESYIRHIYKIYSRIVEAEESDSDMPRKATQKELAKLMGVTENTISRHLN